VGEEGTEGKEQEVKELRDPFWRRGGAGDEGRRFRGEEESPNQANTGEERIEAAQAASIY